MIARIRTWLGSFSPRGIALLLSVVLLGLHGVLLATAFQRNLTSATLEAQVENLRTNIDQLNEVERETLSDLESQLAVAEQEVERLEAQIPTETEPFPLYERAYSLAQSNEIQLLSVVRRESNDEAPQDGAVAVQIHDITSEAEPEACLDLIEAMEADGGARLATAGIEIDSESETCNFQVVAAWLRRAPALGANQGE